MSIRHMLSTYLKIEDISMNDRKNQSKYESAIIKKLIKLDIIRTKL